MATRTTSTAKTSRTSNAWRRCHWRQGNMLIASICSSCSQASDILFLCLSQEDGSRDGNRSPQATNGKVCLRSICSENAQCFPSICLTFRRLSFSMITRCTVHRLRPHNEVGDHDALRTSDLVLFVGRAWPSGISSVWPSFTCTIEWHERTVRRRTENCRSTPKRSDAITIDDGRHEVHAE